MSLAVKIFPERSKCGVVLLGFLPLIFGCANPGPPRLPSLHLAQIVTDLTAERVGDTVQLHWTTPDKTTDAIDVTGPLTAQICRSSSSASACSTTNTVPVKPGASEAVDPLPLELRQDPSMLLTYRVAILNSKQRSAGLSSPAFVGGGPAPIEIAGLHIETTEQGAVLQWTPTDATGKIELSREHKAVANSSAPKTGAGLSTAPKEAEHMRFLVSQEKSAPRNDAGGTVDATARRGETYTYTVQRTKEVVLQGHSLTLRSIPSAVVTITMRDTFPPKPPQKLEAVLGAETTSSTSIDLSWTPNVEQDLTGYLVYRQELSMEGTEVGPRKRLTAAPLSEPGFQDRTVVAGHAYAYSVTALDSTGNESAPSTSARQDVPSP